MWLYQPAVRKHDLPMVEERAAPVQIVTPRLVLRELCVEDWPEAQVLDRDPLVVRYQLNDVLDEAGTQKYLASSVLAASQSPRQVYDFALCLKGDDRLLGRVGLPSLPMRVRQRPPRSLVSRAKQRGLTCRS